MDRVFPHGATTRTHKAQFACRLRFGRVFDWMLIDKFHVDKKHKTTLDVATFALYKFLHHPFIQGRCNYDCWRVSSVAYELDAEEAMTPDELQQFTEYQENGREIEMAQMMGNTDSPGFEDRLKDHETEKEHWTDRVEALCRFDANPFLRNGFFQDPAIAVNDTACAGLLVTSHHHFRKPLKSHAEAAAVQFCPRVAPF